LLEFSKLIEIFFSVHDPTQVNRQGPDVGYQYRSVIFYFNQIQKKTAYEELKKEQEKQAKPIVTLIERASTYIKAENYHQKYLLERGQASCHI
jgi:peptide-methionine (S)-S-oxide reductase